MWKLLKAEIGYRKEIFLLIFLSSIPVFILLTNLRVLDENIEPGKNIAFIFQFYMLCCIFVTVIYNPWIREKRNRRLVPLPVSIRKIGLARAAAEIAYWLFLIILFVAAGLLSKKFVLNGHALLALLGQTGVLLIAYSLACFFLDMILPIDSSGSGSLIERGAAFVLKLLLPLEVFLLLIIQSAAIVSANQGKRGIFYRVFQTGWGAAAVLFLGLVLFVCCLFLFERRRTYADR